MKKTLIALAALAAAGAASAQSSVTLFGVVDAGWQNISADRAPTATSAATTAKVTRLTQGLESSSRLGFRGTEDLGGGLSASFWLEAGLNNDDGTGAASSSTNRTLAAFQGSTTSTTTNGANAPVRSGTQGLTFNRRSTVSLAGAFGEIRLGRDYVPSFLNLTTFDPFGTVGAGSTTNVALNVGTQLGIQTTVRASNSIGYFLPSNLGGFYGNLMYARGELADPVVPAASTGFNEAGDGDVWGARFGYAAGPVNVAYGYTKTKASGALTLANASLALAPATVPTAAQITAARITGGTYTDHNIGASWDFGVAKLMLQLNQERIGDNTGTMKHTTYLIGGTVPVGAGVIKASYNRGKSDDSEVKGHQLAIGYVHNFSKRTAVYTTYSRLVNSGNVAALNYTQAFGVVSPTSVGGDSRGFDIGLRHSF